MQNIPLVDRNILFNMRRQCRLSCVVTFFLADPGISIRIILLHRYNRVDISYFRQNTWSQDWKFTQLTGNEDWLSTWIWVLVLSQGELFNSSVSSNSSFGMVWVPCWSSEDWSGRMYKTVHEGKYRIKVNAIMGQLCHHVTLSQGWWQSNQI